MDWDKKLPLRDPQEVPVELLDFDRHNPRFTPDKMPADESDEAIIEWLDKTSDLGELVQSMAYNGYISIEPMIVYARGERLIVLEGNRRLAALKVLRNPELAATCRISTPPVKDEVRPSFDNILVFRVADKDGAKDLIGFKHINGPRAWDAYAKALYAMHWLDSEREKPNGIHLYEIAQRMGDKHDTLRRMVTAAYVIRQAEEEGVYDLDDRTKRHFSFSHLYTALSYPEFTSFLGMQRASRSEDPDPRPIPDGKLDELKQLLFWLYGSRKQDVEPVIASQAKDLNRLKQVLSAPAAVRELTERGDLDAAVVTATPVSNLFARNLVDASASLKIALENVTGYDPEEQPDLFQFADLCLKRSDTILGAMERQQGKSKKS
ncbi:hypothetical protein N1F89_17010 [Aquibium sp. A9E412]|uniref:hypothetical protein n=1 Tax=Aquibium sp. A9E412 TaxID=2976767 RepID=UPI0025B0B222|nr:hypothetical protein [Aquibium sp. A9E412]MDN2567925.1 hypothetical protein [Aquibium sp. A9E412]